MQTIETGHHPVHIGEDVLERLGEDILKARPSTVFVLCDENSEKHCLPKIRKLFPALTPIRVRSGEKNKDLNAAIKIWKLLSSKMADRRSVLINIGGGMITDLGGFAASVYKRGIRFYNIPTTLLAMVDASSGGKTGIDLGSLKNQIGTFCFPEAVYINPTFLKTLPVRQLNAGLAEALKHGLISDASYWSELRRRSPVKKTDDLATLILRSVEIKSAITAEDPREKGRRKLLNFGHTIGHALESVYLGSRKPFLHGEAVAAGMIAESYLSVKCSGLSAEAAQEIRTTLLPLIPSGKIIVPEKKFFALLRQDKKNAEGEIRFALLASVGQGVIDQYCPDELILEAIEFLNGPC